VAGVHIDQAACGRIVFANHAGGEAAAFKAVGAGVVIQALGQLREGKAFGGEGVQAGLEGGHEKRGRDAFTRDVRHDEKQLAAGGASAVG